MIGNVKNNINICYIYIIKADQKMTSYWIELVYIIYDLLIEPLGIMTMITVYAPMRVILPVQLFSQDSISNSVRYVVRHLGIPIPERDTQRVGGLAKYTFFIVISLCYYLLHILTWMNIPSQLLYYMIAFISSPGLVELLLRQVPIVLDTLELWRKKLLNYLGCLVLSKIINFICYKNLGNDPKITGEELNETLSAQNKVYFWSFIKIFLLTSLIKYLEKNAYYYGRIIKILYNWGTLIEVPKHHRSMILDSQTLHPKDTLSSIIKRRKWYYFYDPTVLNLLIRVYNDKDGNFLEEFLARLNRSFIQFVTIWTLAYYVPIPIMALLFRLPYYAEMGWQLGIMPVIDSVIWWFYGQHVIYLSFFSEFANYLNNPAVRHILKVLWDDYLPRAMEILSHHRKYNFYLVASLPIVYFVGQHEWRFLCILPFIAKYNFIYVWLGVLGIFSDYDIYHLVCLNMILYMMVNLTDYENICRITTIPKIKMEEIELIKSYWPNRTTNSRPRMHESVPQGKTNNQSLEMSVIMMPHST